MSSIPQDLAHCRVLVSGHLPPPMGGIAMFYKSLMESSLSRKVDLQFVQTSSQNRSLSDAGKASISNFISAGQDIFRFWKALRHHKPHITHIATAPGFSFLKHAACVFLADLSGSQVLIHPHCSFSALYSDRSGWWRRFVRLVLRRTDGLIALSSEWKQASSLVHDYPVFMMLNAIHQGDYQLIAAERNIQSRKPEPLQILYLGYLGKAKGSYDLIETAKLILSTRKDVEFHLVGDELSKGERAALQAKISAAEVSENVYLHPPVDYAGKLERYKLADIFVYPSYYEGMPMAVIEAMASGLPVIASEVGGLPDLIENGENGLLTPPGNPQALSEALIKLMDDANLRYSMQLRSSQLASECYEIEKMVDELVEIYRRFCPENLQKRKLLTHEA